MLYLIPNILDLLIFIAYRFVLWVVEALIFLLLQVLLKSSLKLTLLLPLFHSVIGILTFFLDIFEFFINLTEGIHQIFKPYRDYFFLSFLDVFLFFFIFIEPFLYLVTQLKFIRVWKLSEKQL